MPYDDATGERVRAPVGRLTIGVGINLDVGLDEHEVDWLERHRLHVGMVAFEREAAALAFPGPTHLASTLLPDDAQVALSLMVFQLGPDGTLEFHAMLKAIASGDWEGAAAEALDSAWAKETPKRAKMVAALLRGAAAGRLLRSLIEFKFPTSSRMQFIVPVAVEFVAM